MGVYDMLPKGSQLKLWNCEMVTKKVGDTVPDFGLDKYVVILREGGYVLVEKGIIAKIVENYGRKLYYPEDFAGTPCFDKWGSKVESRGSMIGQFDGLVGMSDPYHFRSK